MNFKRYAIPVLFTFLTTMAQAQILYVDDDAAPAGDGTSWNSAYRFLQDGLADAASSGGLISEIRVGQGTYRPDRSSGNPEGSLQINETFQLVNGIALQGGYAGINAKDPNARDIQQYETVLSGILLKDDVKITNSGHVVTGSGTDQSTSISGFTITGGAARCVVGVTGGGMYIDGGGPTLRQLKFIENYAFIAGGALYYSGSDNLLISKCSFIQNGSNKGGAIGTNVNSQITIDSSSFVGNFAAKTCASCGLGCSFTGGKGGAIYVSGGSPQSRADVTNCNFVGNVAQEGFHGGWGGAIYGNAHLSITNSTFAHNQATSGAVRGANLTIINSVIQDNGGGSIASDMPIVSHSNILGGYEGEGNIDVDPKFVRNPSPGPDGKWGTVDDDYGDLRLRPGSPAIDAGNNELLNSGTDLAGNPRFYDDPGTPDTGLGRPPIVDMGAYEFQGVTCLGDVNNDGTVGVQDLVQVIQNWNGSGVADINNDGTVDVQDMSQVILNWGNCR